MVALYIQSSTSPEKSPIFRIALAEIDRFDRLSSENKNGSKIESFKICSSNNHSKTKISTYLTYVYVTYSMSNFCSIFLSTESFSESGKFNLNIDGYVGPLDQSEIVNLLKSYSDDDSYNSF